MRKSKIFEVSTFQFQKDGETVCRDLQDLQEILEEYEENFSIDEIVIYRQQAFNLIKDTKNIIQIIEKQNKVLIFFYLFGKEYYYRSLKMSIDLIESSPFSNG